jgi:hypothetical protein
MRRRVPASKCGRLRFGMGEATLNYLRPGGPPNRRYVAPGAEMNTGTYDPYLVDIADARLINPTLESYGFQLVDHRSTVADFTSAGEVDALYYSEADALIRQVTGADLTLPFGWMLRSSGPAAGGCQPPAADVHVDLTPDRARSIGDAFLIREGYDPARFGHFLITSLWRCFSPPPQDWPLALCAGHSVAEGEGVPNLMIHVDQLPTGDAAFAPLDNEAQYPAASVFEYNPQHRWFTYPDMARDEAVIITFYDSERGLNWRVPHTAFHDPSAAATAPRQSIELRSIAYWAA